MGKKRSPRAGQYGVLKGPLEVREVPLPPGGALKLVVLADTHSKINQAGLEQVAAEKPGVILHGGDIGDLGVLDQLEAVAPVIAVRGNIDALGQKVPTTVIIKWTLDGQTRSVWLLTHIALRGPRLYGEIVELAKEHGAQLVVCGHSHVPFLGMDKGLAVFNPGSIGPRRFSLPITYGRVTMNDNGIDFVHMNCETRQPLRLGPV